MSTQSSIEELALFPLSDVVLLPQVSVPLFIFEPRYRLMTRDALEGSRLIGMVAVRPDAVSGMQGDPPLFEIGCIGRIAHSQQRPDGTFQILLLGENRFRILEEHSRTDDRLYRIARVERLEDARPTTEEANVRLKASRMQVLELLSQLVHRTQRAAAVDEQLTRFAELDSTHLINALAQSISFDPIERQQLLEADSILARFQTMEELLRFRLAGAGSVESGSRSLPNLIRDILALSGYLEISR